MNKIEQMFYDAYREELFNPENEICCVQFIKPQYVIGIYKVDFVVNYKFVIEIDGYEFHKTKEQREADYKRERYLLRNGYTTIRFTGTEIYLSCRKCAVEAMKLIDDLLVAADYNDAVSCDRHYRYMKEQEAKGNG
jgi:very-short-patch-repair endonuclease